MTREERIDQLSKAITDYIENPPELSTKADIARIARRHAVSPRDLWRAIGLLRDYEDGRLDLFEGESNGNQNH